MRGVFGSIGGMTGIPNAPGGRQPETVARRGQRVKKSGSGAVQLCGLVLVLSGLILPFMVLIGFVVIILGAISARAVMCSVCGNGVAPSSRICPTCHAELSAGPPDAGGLVHWMVLLVFVGVLGYGGWRYVRERSGDDAPRRGPLKAGVRSDGSYRDYDFAVLSSDAAGASGYLRDQDGKEEPVFVIDLPDHPIGTIWRGPLYPCGEHTYAETGRKVRQFATKKPTAEAVKAGSSR